MIILKINKYRGKFMPEGFDLGGKDNVTFDDDFNGTLALVNDTSSYHPETFISFDDALKFLFKSIFEFLSRSTNSEDSYHGLRALQTSPDDDNSSSGDHSEPVGIVIAKVIGGLFACITVGLIYYFCCYEESVKSKVKKQMKKEGITVENPLFKNIYESRLEVAEAAAKKAKDESDRRHKVWLKDMENKRRGERERDKTIQKRAQLLMRYPPYPTETDAQMKARWEFDRRII